MTQRQIIFAKAELSHIMEKAILSFMIMEGCNIEKSVNQEVAYWLSFIFTMTDRTNTLITADEDPVNPSPSILPSLVESQILELLYLGKRLIPSNFCRIASLMWWRGFNTILILGDYATWGFSPWLGLSWQVPGGGSNQEWFKDLDKWPIWQLAQNK